MKFLLDFYTSKHWGVMRLAGEMVIHPISSSKSHQRSNPINIDRDSAYLDRDVGDTALTPGMFRSLHLCPLTWATAHWTRNSYMVT